MISGSIKYSQSRDIQPISEAENLEDWGRPTRFEYVGSTTLICQLYLQYTKNHADVIDALILRIKEIHKLLEPTSSM